MIASQGSMGGIIIQKKNQSFDRDRRNLLDRIYGWAAKKEQILEPYTDNEKLIKKRIERFKKEERILDLSNLGLRELPECIRTLKNIAYLNLAGNELQELPSWINELESLQVLDLSSNKFKKFPDDIGSLYLLMLYLENNMLETLPDNLSRIPVMFMDLQGNPKLGIPESVLNGRPEEILRYYFESRNEKGRPLLELKLLLVGRGKAGKTTLVKQLAGEEPKENESETHSISIRELSFKCSRGQVRTRAWDFGGQEILHSTHQFFLTERSLYLLVLEYRTGSAQRDAEYWLKLIETEGNKSPVIIILNYSHEHLWQVDRVKLRRKYPFIVDFVSTDALYGDGIEELRHVILKTIDEQMQDVWLPFPERWRRIKDAVAGCVKVFLPQPI